MRECPVCTSSVPLHTDWCSNGHYAGWQDAPRGASEPADRPPDPPLNRAPRVLTGTIGDTPERVVLEPGQTERLRVFVRNQSDVVRRFRVGVDGLPGDCWSATPSEFGLNPWGTEPPCEQELAVELSPWDSELAPGAHPVRIVVIASGSGTEFEATRLIVEVRPIRDVAAELIVKRRRGFRSGRYAVELHNRGNATSTVEIACADPDGELRFHPARQALRAAARSRSTAPIRVRTRRWRLTGPVEERPFSVAVTADGARVDGILPASLGHRSLFPWLSTRLVSVLALAGIAATIAAGAHAMSARPAHSLPPAPTATPTPGPAPMPTQTPAPTPTPTPVPTRDADTHAHADADARPASHRSTPAGRRRVARRRAGDERDDRLHLRPGGGHAYVRHDR